jgi:hypothetical protein
LAPLIDQSSNDFWTRLLPELWKLPIKPNLTYLPTQLPTLPTQLSNLTYPTTYPTYPTIYPTYPTTYPTYPIIYPTYPTTYPTYPTIYPTYPTYQPFLPNLPTLPTDGWSQNVRTHPVRTRAVILKPESSKDGS